MIFLGYLELIPESSVRTTVKTKQKYKT